jgi:pimeloyl-ACP methyl ester carboxylesterase
MQFWTDELLFHRWRIQSNALTGHYRLLDGQNRRHAWGTFEQCQAKLDELKLRDQLPPMSGRAVIVMHGLADPRRSMSTIAKYLEQTERYSVFNLAYASTRGDVGQHAAALDRVIQRLVGIEEINFVAHSLGNLVIRHYFRDQTASGRGPDVRIKRIVMLGPPNQGAQLAKRMGRNGLFEFFAGASGQQLAAKWDELQSKLAIPTCEFGIIAGGIGTTNGRNPLIQGDDDFVVRVDETRLAGARDFAVLPVIHTIMMNDPKVMEYTARFLEHGYFISEDERQPITHDADEGGAQE